MICFSETWLDDTDSNSLYELPNYISKHQIRDDRKGGGVSFYIHNSLSFRVLPNLCINSTDIESLSIEISLNDQLNTLVNVLTNCFIDRTFKTAIFKSDILNHFPICFIIPSMKN